MGQNARTAALDGRKVRTIRGLRSFERTGGLHPDERAVELRQNTWLNRNNELLVHAPAPLMSRSMLTWPNFLASLG
jgi:hypothetical protein